MRIVSVLILYAYEILQYFNIGHFLSFVTFIMIFRYGTYFICRTFERDTKSGLFNEPLRRKELLFNTLPLESPRLRGKKILFAEPTGSDHCFTGKEVLIQKENDHLQ